MFEQDYEFNGYRFRFLFDGSNSGSGVILDRNKVLSVACIDALKHAHTVFRARFQYAHSFEYQDYKGVLKAFEDPYTEFTPEFIAKKIAFYEDLKKRRQRELSEKPPRKEVSKKKRGTVLKRDGYKCQNCGFSDPFNPTGFMHVDHIKPLSKGGTNHYDNLQVLCQTCNLKKGNKYEEES